MRLLIVSAALHFRHGQQLYGYIPYVREIDVWSDLFDEVLIAAPCRNTEPPGDYAPFTKTNISIVSQKEVGGETVRAKIALVFSVPKLILGLARAMRRADAIHVRCPGNLGLLGALLAPLFSSRLVAKYAGQWNGHSDTWTLRLQRAVLRSRWWEGPVTVYGHWSTEPPHVVPFFTSVLSETQLQRGLLVAQSRKSSSTLRVLYVGRLSCSKNVDVLLTAISKLIQDGVSLRCRIVGDGPERGALQRLRDTLHVSTHVEFTGGVAFEKVLEFMELSDVLVLASNTEGWPKVIAEAMLFGLLCIGPNCGIIPEMLGDGRGFVVPPRDVDALCEVLRQIASHPEQHREIRARASAWASQYSLEALRSALRDLLVQHWGAQVGKSGRLQLEGATS